MSKETQDEEYEEVNETEYEIPREEKGYVPLLPRLKPISEPPSDIGCNSICH